MKVESRNMEKAIKKRKQGEKKQEKEIKQSTEYDAKKIKKKKKKDISIEPIENRDEIVESTEEIVEENENTEVKKKEVSKRQLKREKAELRATEIREASKKAMAHNALNYVSKWKHIRSEWKFEKLKQIWLIENLLDDKYVSSEHFTTILEYFEGCKGSARKQLIDKATKVVRKIEDAVENDEELLETTEYKRARELLQALPTET